MRRSCLFLLVLLLSFSVHAQKNKVDSLRSLLAVERADSNRVTLLWKMGDAYKASNPDSSILLAQQGLELARKIKFLEGESRSLGIIANGYVATGNYPRALEYYLKKLALEEKRSSPRNLASVTMNIGLVYFYQEEFDKALLYYRRSDSIIQANDVKDFKYSIQLNQGELYYQQKQFDQAYAFFKRSLDVAVQQENRGNMGTSLVGLANVYLKKADFENSKLNYWQALPLLAEDNNEEVICEACLGMATIYDSLGKNDSARIYAHRSLFLSQKDGFLSWQLKAVSFLNDHFKKSKLTDSAYVYLYQSKMLNDSINSKERIRQSQVLSSNEQIRQAEIAEEKKKAKKERMQQLQLLFIGIFIPAFFLFTLLLSRRKVHVNVIKFLGVISLLILFEYLTLLLHPYVLDMTNHIPILELLIFVCIAAILIRLHHKIEHWFINKLIQGHHKHTHGRFPIKKMRMKIKKPSD